MKADLTADEWNREYPVGTRVLAFPGTREGRALLTRTRTEAWTIGGHTAGVSVEGYAGGIALTHIEIAQIEPAEETDESYAARREREEWERAEMWRDKANGYAWKHAAAKKILDEHLRSLTHNGKRPERASQCRCLACDIGRALGIIEEVDRG